ncbi:DASS family sodium-coupled anion symporter [Nitrosomonadales bacterium]|nr:DASS family sodium-coupled anion symporter [Methylophilaceae bacterium]MDA9600563.1 DASS family sodium-coupled anion symporter [Nitrosomonadales bacterium]
MHNQSYRKLGFWIGLLLFFSVILNPTPESLSIEGWHVAAVALLMAAWWGTEAVPLPVTALVPLAAFPLLQISSLKETAISYANPHIFLFLGGFILALAIQRSGLHKRLALSVASKVNASAGSIVGAFMCISFFISMWVMNTSTTLMLLPICLAICIYIKEALPGLPNKQIKNFEIALFLGIAYASSIGGMSSLIGTAPNIVFAGFMQENYNIDISFMDWMKIALPIGLMMLVASFIILTKIIYPSTFEINVATKSKINQALEKLGGISRDEKKVFIIFLIAASLWISRPYLKYHEILLGLTDAGIAILAAILLFILPSDNKKSNLLEWDETKKLPWGLLLLFGGGLSLASSISSSGLGQWLGTSFSLLVDLKPWLIILLITTFIVFLTELTSNTATTSTFLPIATSIAVAISVAPISIAIPLVMASSLAFMLPVATPPNAIVYGSGKITIGNMIRAGFILNLIGILIITLVSHYLLPASLEKLF